MEKNVIVVDEHGDQIGVTYPKRAKGLVKNGRARYVDASTICLACPPNGDLEDNMSENINEVVETMETAEQYDIAYVMRQMEIIAQDTGYLYAGLEALRDNSDDGVGIGFGNAVEARENTNQRLIWFYEKVYDDLKREQRAALSQEDRQSLHIDQLIEELTRCGRGDETRAGILSDVLKKIMDRNIDA